ncbi:LOW QUALITY PROTEIN: hypothetical protein U9M48_018548, partial [Paspalum notatum var. saurae]
SLCWNLSTRVQILDFAWVFVRFNGFVLSVIGVCGDFVNLEMSVQPSSSEMLIEKRTLPRYHRGEPREAAGFIR